MANALPIDLARIGQEQGLSGTTFAALGFGAWGVEPTTVAEFDAPDRLAVQVYLWTIFASYPEEQAIYMELNDEGQEVHRREGTNIPDFNL